MSSLLSFGMPPSKKEKQYANTRARRHSGEVIVSQSKKSKKDKDKDKDKDTDSESVTTSSSSDTIVVPPPKKQCPLRALYTVMMEPEGKEGKGGCPFRRVQLWHTIPLCILAIVIPLLVGLTVLISLLGLAGYKISMGAQATVVRLMKANPTLKPYAESFTESDDGATLVAEEKH